MPWNTRYEIFLSISSQNIHYLFYESNLEIRIEPFRGTQRDAAPCLEEESKGRAEMIPLTWAQSSPPSSGDKRWTLMDLGCTQVVRSHLVLMYSAAAQKASEMYKKMLHWKLCSILNLVCGTTALCNYRSWSCQKVGRCRAEFPKGLQESGKDWTSDRGQMIRKPAWGKSCWALIAGGQSLLIVPSCVNMSLDIPVLILAKHFIFFNLFYWSIIDLQLC